MNQNQKKRKPLADALANEFVYGGSKSDEPEKLDDPAPTVDEEEATEVLENSDSNGKVAPAKKPASKKTKKELSLMDKLEAQAQSQSEKEPTVRITVDMPESLHHKLSVFVAKKRMSKTGLVLFLLEETLKDVEEP